MDSKTTIQHNNLMQLENSMLMHGIYNAETLGKLINSVNHIHTQNLCMGDYLQDSKVPYLSDHFTQIH